MNSTILVSLIFFGLAKSVHGYPGTDDKESKMVELTAEVLINWEWIHELKNDYKEDIEKIDIKIQFPGLKFRVKNFNVQVINNDVLVVKAEEDGKKFEQKYKLPAHGNNLKVNQIQARIGINEDKTQILQIHIFKNIKRIQVPVFMMVKVDETNEENKNWISHDLDFPTQQLYSPKRTFFSHKSYREDMEKVEIKIQLQGHKFKAKNLNVQVINDDVLFIKAKDDEEKFESLIKLPSNVLINKIKSKFEKKTQTLYFNLPKVMKVSTHDKYTIRSGGNDCVSFLEGKILHSALCFVYCTCESQMPGNRATCCNRN